MALILGSRSSLSVILRLARGDVCRLHLACINLLLPWNNAEELLPSSATEPHKYPRKTSGNKSYAPAVVHVCKVVLVLKKKMCRDPCPAGDLLTNTHTVVHIQRKLCVKLTICGLVFIFCLVMRAGL